MDASGFEAAKRHVMECLRRGGDMAQANPLTQRDDFLWVQVGTDETLEQIFELTNSGTSSPTEQKSDEKAPQAKKRRLTRPALACEPSVDTTPSAVPQADATKKRQKCKQPANTTPDKKKEELKELNKPIAKASLCRDLM